MKTVLFLTDSYKENEDFDSFRLSVIDNLQQANINLVAVRTNDFISPHSIIPGKRSFYRELRKRLRSLNPDVIITFNRAGLSTDLLPNLKDTRIVNWFVDSYTRTGPSLMNFYNDDHNIIFGINEYHDTFVNHFDVKKDQVYQLPFGTDTSTFKPMDIEQDIDICFVSTAFDNKHFCEIYDDIKQDSVLLKIFTDLFLKHKEKYIWNFSDQLFKDGFNCDNLTQWTQQVLRSHSTLQSIVDDQISGEMRIKALSSLARFNMKFYGEPQKTWIKYISTINTNLLNNYCTESISTSKELNHLYNRSKISLNIPHQQAFKYGLPLRVFDIMATNSLLLTHHFSKEPLEYLGFKEKEDFVCYYDTDDLKKTCQYYIDNEAERVKITQSAQEKVLDSHGMNNRIDEILKIAGLEKANGTAGTCQIYTKQNLIDKSFRLQICESYLPNKSKIFKTIKFLVKKCIPYSIRRRVVSLFE